MGKVVIMDHPLIQHKIGYIRRIDTGTKDFRQTISEIAMLICYEATRELQLLGLYRDPETLKPVEYYCKMPADVSEREIFVVDPMLATGGSSVAAINMLKEKGCKHIHFMCIIAAPEGLKAMQEAHPDVDIYVGALDEKLNEHGYIVPGLGDAGDRIFGTK